MSKSTYLSVSTVDLNGIDLSLDFSVSFVFPDGSSVVKNVTGGNFASTVDLAGNMETALVKHNDETRSAYFIKGVQGVLIFGLIADHKKVMEVVTTPAVDPTAINIEVPVKLTGLYPETVTPFVGPGSYFQTVVVA